MIYYSNNIQNINFKYFFKKNKYAIASFLGYAYLTIK